MAECGPPSKGQAYRQASGLIVICMYCRRTLRPGTGGKGWEMVEEFITTPPAGISHGLCGDCMKQQLSQQP